MSTVAQTLSKPRAKTFRDIVKPARALELKEQIALALDTLRKIRSAQRSPFSASSSASPLSSRQLAHQRPSTKMSSAESDLGSDTVSPTASVGLSFPATE